MQLFSEKLEKIWNEWEIRVLILISLLLQVILIIFGARRKFTRSMTVRMLVWSAYLAADVVASIALGNLAHSNLVEGQGEFSESKMALQAFWAPFLLLHLGGPDTITAYSLEDNELWARHLLGLLVQVGVAFYVFFKSWSDTAITFIAIPMFVTGIIKYGERTFVLWSSSMAHFRNSLESSPDPDQAKDRIVPLPDFIIQAYLLFKRSVYLFADLILDHNGENDPCYAIIHEKAAKPAFELVESELGFMYDVLFTKATIVYSLSGIFLRCLSFFSSVTALILFSIIIDIHAYPKADVYVTYSLLVTAVFLEIYASILFLLSDWTKIWLIKANTAEHGPILKRIFHLLSRVAPRCVCKPSKRSSRSMGQYSLINASLKYESATFIGVPISKLVDIKKYRCLTWKIVNRNLQKSIFKHIQDMSNDVLINLAEGFQPLTQALNRRGDYVLEKRYGRDRFRWSITEVDFDHSLLVWHIATDICYYVDLDSHENRESKALSEKSKTVSDYLLYLLVFCPSMLRKGISHEKRYKDTDNAIRTFKRTYASIVDASSACVNLLAVRWDNPLTNEGKMSVLRQGKTLAADLQRTAECKEEKWKMISEVWMEMLIYAASHCAWKEHAQQLSKGGELLTHVSLVMSHLGLSEHYHMKHLYSNMGVADMGSWFDLF